MVDRKHTCNQIDKCWRMYAVDVATLMGKLASLGMDSQLHVSIHCTTSSPDLVAATNPHCNDSAVHQYSIAMVSTTNDAVVPHTLAALNRPHFCACSLQLCFDIAENIPMKKNTE